MDCLRFWSTHIRAGWKWKFSCFEEKPMKIYLLLRLLYSELPQNNQWPFRLTFIRPATNFHKSKQNSIGISKQTFEPPLNYNVKREWGPFSNPIQNWCIKRFNDNLTFNQSWRWTLKLGSIISAESLICYEWFPSCFFLRLRCFFDSMTIVHTAYFQNLALVSIILIFAKFSYFSVFNRPVWLLVCSLQLVASNPCMN